MDLDEVGRRLDAEHAQTSARIGAMSADLTAVAEASAGGNIDDEHDPEGSTIAFEREQLAAVRAAALEHLTEIDAARVRVREGRYGVCERCGRPVGDERLAALPATRWCVTCAAAARAQRR